MTQINSSKDLKIILAFMSRDVVAGGACVKGSRQIDPKTIGLAQRYEFLNAHQELLCIELEALADQLPRHVDTLAAKLLADMLQPTIRACQEFEEGEVFPAILKLDPSLAPTIARLRAEHVEDEDHAALVSETIMRFIHSPGNADADLLGYLIRGLFQPLRRHSAFDRKVILPLCLLAQQDHNGSARG